MAWWYKLFKMLNASCVQSLMLTTLGKIPKEKCSSFNMIMGMSPCVWRRENDTQPTLTETDGRASRLPRPKGLRRAVTSLHNHCHHAKLHLWRWLKKSRTNKTSLARHLLHATCLVPRHINHCRGGSTMMTKRGQEKQHCAQSPQVEFLFVAVEEKWL